MRFIRLTLLIFTAVTVGQQYGLCQPASPAQWKTGDAWTKQLDETVLLSVEGVSLRDFLRRMEQSYGIATVLDRRIDPEQTVRIESSGSTLKGVFESLAESIGAGVSFPPHVVYLGPRRAAESLRTIAEARTEQLKQTHPGLIETRTFSWDDLDEPKEIVTRLLEPADLKPGEFEFIPHDLWAGTTLPETSFVTALSLVLIQYDRTFVMDANAIRAIGLPDDARIERTYRLKNRERIASWPLAAPTAEIAQQGQRVTVKGRVEDFEGIEAVRNGTWKANSEVTEAIPLSQRRFTLKISQVRVSQVMEELENSGIRFVYDQNEFENREIDLSQVIAIDVNEADAGSFFNTLFEPLNVSYRIRGITVELNPGRGRF